MQIAEPITPTDFRDALEEVVIRELRIWQSILSSETMRVFDLGCFPWHGHLELSFLTIDEPRLLGCSDVYDRIADRRLYNFASTRASAARKEREHLGARMSKTWYSSQDKTAAAESFLQATALAVTSQTISDELDKFHHTADFVVTVFDPDHPRRGNLLVRA